MFSVLINAPKATILLHGLESGNLKAHCEIVEFEKLRSAEGKWVQSKRMSHALLIHRFCCRL